ncbi:hypothetical protein C6V83_09480 [Gordonia iterans]|uniref:YCII-related domain-containing protein n=1 Tax=Gordonia iterans TaxID=1004901 RepID=A0A2S0KFL9_9ACTN|nr:YciI family protein [Gordonia iterans]AVM00469.1 hypothetical protein C6V83_09480 [Gordonia iterans]
MPNFAVEYTYDPAQASLRDAHRPAHRRWLKAAHDDGEVLAVGAFADGSGALVVVEAVDEQAAAALLSRDPFALAGAIAHTRIREWASLYGPFGS